MTEVDGADYKIGPIRPDLVSRCTANTDEISVHAAPTANPGKCRSSQSLAQSGRALGLEPRGRRFKSYISDHYSPALITLAADGDDLAATPTGAMETSR